MIKHTKQNLVYNMYHLFEMGLLLIFRQFIEN